MASTDIFNRKVSVPEWMAKWWKFDQAFSARVMAGGWANMTKKELGYAEIQTAILALAVAGCAVIGKDQKPLPTVDQLYSPAGEMVPMNMFGQSVIFYSTHPEYIELGLVAEQVQVIQLEDSGIYKAMQIMEVQDADGDLIYNIMFQTKKGEVEQEWVVLINDTFNKLDIVQKDGKTEFVADMGSNMGQITPTEIIIDTPKEDAQIPISLDSVIGLISGAKPVLAADEATSTLESSPTFTPTETSTPTATATETATPPLIPSKYALKAAEGLGDGAKAIRFLVSSFDGKHDGPYGKEWYYVVESGNEKWILAMFANYYDPITGRGNICLKGDCSDLVGKVIDVIVPPGTEYYDPGGELHNGIPYVLAAAIIEGEK